eukprot:scaffold74856_cov30-Cyclotella_meneghiniana.AAC.1
MSSKIATTVLLLFASIASAQQLIADGFFDNDDLNSNSCGCQYGDGTFCGTDGQCHLYSCENFYEYGPVDYTGYSPDSKDASSSPELVCNDISTTTVKTAGDSSQASVAFRCRDLTPKPIGMGWTRYCEASSSNSNFTCYGLADNTDFSLFLQQAETSRLECNSGKYDETGYPAYSYSVSMQKQEGNHGIYIINTVGYNDTQEFDENKALTGTMSTTFEAWTDEPTSSPISIPTYSPVYYSPTENSSAGKNVFVAKSST